MVLCNYINYLTAGVKILDKRAIDLCLGRPLCSRMDNLLGFSCQSQNFCFIFKSLIGKDSKDAYNNLKDFFLVFDTLNKEGLQESEHGHEL
jgi:hypothetical protein